MTTIADSIADYQRQRGDHPAYSLSPSVLARLEWYLSDYFHGQSIRSAETGCGVSTVMFARYAGHHTVYCVDDRSKKQLSNVTYAQHFPSFPNKRVKWIFGPPHQTALRQPPDAPLDMLLLDAAHAYPLPDLQYYAFYKWLRPGSILVLDDIHIPTINHLYNFLLADDSFRTHGATSTTAYFQRTDARAFDTVGDSWWHQRYNAQRFPAFPISRVDERFELPIRMVFDQSVLTQPRVLARGFSLVDTPPISEGAVSQIEVPLPKQLPVRLNIALDIEPICPYERDAGIVVLVNSKVVGEWPLKSPARQVLELETVPEYPDLLSLEFWNKGLKPATELRDWPHPWPQPWFDARLPNFRLHALSITDPASQAVARNVVRADGSVVSFDYEDQTFTFFIDQLDDSVEIFPSLGRFYEVHELELLRSHVPQGASILDVGAHVGNHTVYFARVMKAKRVVAIEPSSHAGFLLRTNCALNHLTNVDLSHLGKALGDDSGFGSLLRADPYNSGGTRLRSGGGPVPIVRGDDLFKGERFDLIKIDVEGMELRVLSGLAETIARSRPRIFVEVIDDNRQDFQVFIDGHDYQVTWEGQMYPGISNILLEPKKDSACPS